MADRPIIFSAPMVRALLEGRKSQTRRLLKPQPKDANFFRVASVDRHITKGWGAYSRDLHRIADVRVPYAPGDRLYVREAWRSASVYDDLSPAAMGGDEPIRYEADKAWQTWGWGAPLRTVGRLRPSIHMPRWASRLTLTVTDVRVQRLQEISAYDVQAEGAIEFALLPPTEDDETWAFAIFRDLWNSLHGPDAWDANPWVAAIGFTVAKRNIDQVAA